MERIEGYPNYRNFGTLPDTCFIKTDRNINNYERLMQLTKENLVRVLVNTGNIKHEICHCCKCCCFPLMASRAFSQRLLLPSGYYPKFSLLSCSKCKTCHDVCPSNAINDNLVVDLDKCLGCGLCEKNCQQKSIIMTKQHETQVRSPPIKIFSYIYLVLLRIPINLPFRGLQ